METDRNLLFGVLIQLNRLWSDQLVLRSQFDGGTAPLLGPKPLLPSCE